MNYVACYREKNGKEFYTKLEARDILAAHEKAEKVVYSVGTKYCWLLTLNEFKRTFYEKLRRS